VRLVLDFVLFVALVVNITTKSTKNTKTETFMDHGTIKG